METTAEQGKKNREKIYKFVIDYITEHGYAPTFREMGKGVGLRSTSTVHNHIRTLISMGLLETDAEEGSPRALRMPGYRLCKID